tara:strand:+ start:29485 stop:30726 length:1242 start_codon:yes stop_codon:yes gene_type:complete
MKINFNYKIILFILFLLGFFYFDNINYYFVNKFYLFKSRIKGPLPDIDICNELQSGIEDLISLEKNNWSISVIDDKRRIIVNINGDIPRIPASNNKIYTTAFALNKLGKDFRIKTYLIKNNNGDFIIYGGGDPDISESYFKLISKYLNKSISNTNNKIIKLYIHEERPSLWWPVTWSSDDREETYGAPITRLSILSNSDVTLSPIDNFTIHIKNNINYNYINYLDIIPVTNVKFTNKPNIVNILSSAPMQSLLSLSNSESHNFTAEVLLRHASNTWDNDIATKKLAQWLNSLNINFANTLIADGSGLSRNNRTTSNTMASFLWLMSKQNNFDYLISSFAIPNQRGTLYEFNYNNNFKFYGKTGTLSGVKSLSGYLQSKKQKLNISILSENSPKSMDKLVEIMSFISSSNVCLI